MFFLVILYVSLSPCHWWWITPTLFHFLRSCALWFHLMPVLLSLSSLHLLLGLFFLLSFYLVRLIVLIFSVHSCFYLDRCIVHWLLVSINLWIMPSITTLVLMSSFLTVSLLVIPSIALVTLLWVTVSSTLWCVVWDKVFVPNAIAGSMTVCMIFFFRNIGILWTLRKLVFF